MNFQYMLAVGFREGILDVEPKIRGKNPKMDGLYHGKPYEQMDDLGGFSHDFWFNTHMPFSPCI